MVDFLWALIIMSSSYLLHEIGHYFMAWKLKLQPKFIFGFEGILRLGFAVKCENELKNTDLKDVLSHIDKILFMSAGGVFGLIPLLIYGTVSKDYVLSTSLCFIMTLYSLYEVTSSVSHIKLTYIENPSTSSSVVKG